MRTKLTKDQELEICRLYVEEGIGSTTIARNIGCSESTIRRCLDRNNVELRQPKKFNLEEIKNLYLSGVPIHVIATKLGSYEGTISKKLKAMGIEIKHSGIAKFNEHIFDSIDTEEKAYWLGFIFADGYIATINPEKKNYAFELSLKSTDFEHLNKFNTFMDYKGNNVKIARSKHKDTFYERCRWGISNEHLWNTLNNYGCTPKKSLTLKFPDKSIFVESELYSKEELIRHFIRGYFDGDGTLTYSNKEHSVPESGFAGTKEFLEGISEYIPEKLLIVQRTNSNTYYMNSSYRKSITLLHYLYDNSNIYLDRKYKLFEHFCRSYE